MNGSAEAKCGKKASKPFCSLAYLAKSTAAINGSNDVRIVNGGTTGGGAGGGGGRASNYQTSSPNLAATAKVNERSVTPGLPTGATTNGHHYANNKNQHQIDESMGGIECDNNNNNNNHQQSVVGATDIFGIINEEDQLDSNESADLRRPWEFSNTYVKRVPPALQTNGLNGHQQQPQHYFYNGSGGGGGGGGNGSGGGSGLTSLSKLNSLDCWDYTIELECLKGPQGEYQVQSILGLDWPFMPERSQVKCSLERKFASGQHFYH